MTASIGARRTALATVFVAILLGILYASNELLHPLALLAAFGIVIAVIGAAVVGWEHVVAHAESAGLVERSD